MWKADHCQVTEADLRAVVDSGLEEHLRLEYKSARSPSRSSWEQEFLHQYPHVRQCGRGHSANWHFGRWWTSKGSQWYSLS